jgi:hypothetical protein
VKILLNENENKKKKKITLHKTFITVRIQVPKPIFHHELALIKIQVYFFHFRLLHLPNILRVNESFQKVRRKRKWREKRGASEGERYESFFVCSTIVFPLVPSKAWRRSECCENLAIKASFIITSFTSCQSFRRGYPDFSCPINKKLTKAKAKRKKKKLPRAKASRACFAHLTSSSAGNPAYFCA